MKLSCLPVSLYTSFASGTFLPNDWFRMARTLGLDGADLSVSHVTSRGAIYLNGLRREAANAGVQIAMLATYTDFTHPLAAWRARHINDLRAWIEAAERLGVTYLRLTAGQAHAGLAQAEGLDWATAGLTACLDDAAAAGVQLLYENHVRGAVWIENDFTQPSERFLEVVRRTAGTNLRILFDTANNLALNEDPVTILRQVSDRVGAIHLSDIRRAGAFEPTVIGTGVAPIPQVLEIMRGSGFDGWVSIEEASRTGEEGFRQAVAFARQAIKRLGDKVTR